MVEQDSAAHILLVEDDVRLRDTRAFILRSQGFPTTCVGSLDEAWGVWQPGKFALVLVGTQTNPDEVLAFCDELKERDADQLVALISQHHVWIPPNPCPDDVIPNEQGPGYFVARVKHLLEGTQAAPA